MLAKCIAMRVSVRMTMIMRVTVGVSMIVRMAMAAVGVTVSTVRVAMPATMRMTMSPTVSKNENSDYIDYKT